MTSQAAFGPPFFRGAGENRDASHFLPTRSTRPRNAEDWENGKRPQFSRHRHALALAAALVTACTTERLYEGPPLPADERAIVHADPAVSAGLPVQLRLRQVNGRDVALSSSAVELPPGEHRFLVDCRVEESGSVRRFVVEAMLEAGGRYRLVADASARNCEAVELIGD